MQLKASHNSDPSQHILFSGQCHVQRVFLQLLPHFLKKQVNPLSRRFPNPACFRVFSTGDRTAFANAVRSRHRALLEAGTIILCDVSSTSQTGKILRLKSIPDLTIPLFVLFSPCRLKHVNTQPHLLCYSAEPRFLTPHIPHNRGWRGNTAPAPFLRTLHRHKRPSTQYRPVQGPLHTLPHRPCTSSHPLHWPFMTAIGFGSIYPLL